MLHDLLGDLMSSCRATSLAQAFIGLHTHTHTHEARRMCAYMSDERTRVFRQTEQKYQGMVADLRDQVERHKQQFRDKVRETVDAEVKHKSDQIAELQNQMRQGGDS
eukprot:2626328-Amphidinium_carterae.1